jgi:hypothetical protein
MALIIKAWSNYALGKEQAISRGRSRGTNAEEFPKFPSHDTVEAELVATA